MLHLALHMADGDSTYRIDDQDHFANRRIRSVGELIQNQVRVGLSRMERVVRRAHDDPGRRGHHAPDADQHPPGGRRREGVFGTSQLSQFMDQKQPLSGLAHKRRLSASPRWPVARARRLRGP